MKSYKHQETINKLERKGFRVTMNGQYGTHMVKRIGTSGYVVTVDEHGLVNGQTFNDYYRGHLEHIKEFH